jgi:hypothetical protein
MINGNAVTRSSLSIFFVLYFVSVLLCDLVCFLIFQIYCIFENYLIYSGKYLFESILPCFAPPVVNCAPEGAPHYHLNENLILTTFGI